MDVQWQIKQNVSEANEYLKDLSSWSKKQKTKRARRKQAGKETEASTEDSKDKVANYVPPVRGKVEARVRNLGKEYSQPTRELAVHAPAQKASRKKKKKKKSEGAAADNFGASAAGHTYDYFKDKWDKFDVDAALREASESSSYETEDEGAEEEAVGVVEEIASPAPPARRRQIQNETKIQRVGSDLTPTQWKEKGNEYFRTKQYQRAVECYTGSIKAEATAVAYANRAMALLKLGHFDQAQEDSTAALAIDPSYLKAYQRRATANKELGLYLAATMDYELALRLSPQSQALRAERKALVDLYCAQEGLDRIRSRVVLRVTDERQREEERRDPVPTQKMAPARADEGKGKENGDEVTPPRSEGADKERREAHVAKGGGETARAKEARSEPKIMASPARDVLVPKNAVEFEIAWKSLRDDEVGQWGLLRRLDPSGISSLLKDLVTGQMFFGIIKCALVSMKGEHATVSEEDVDHGTRLLQSMAQAPRFKINVLSIPSKNRAVLKREWEHHIEHSKDRFKPKFLELAKVYGAIK